MWFQGRRDGPGAYTHEDGKVVNGAWKNDSLYLNYDETEGSNTDERNPTIKVEEIKETEDW